MSAQSKPLPNEMLLEMVNYVPLKIVHKKCVVPTNASLLLTNSILTKYLRGKTEKMLQLISEMSNPELYRNDEDELCVTNTDGTALNSVDLLRHFCLNNVLLQRESDFFAIKHLLPKDFQPLQFLDHLMKYAATCANPWTMANKICMYFPAIDEKELPDKLKMPAGEKKKKLNPLIAVLFPQVIILPVYNGNQKFLLHFGVERNYAQFCKVGDDYVDYPMFSGESTDNSDEKDNDESMENFADDESDESME